jgi:hypothetical protein
MSLSPSSGGRPTRRAREQRAYRLVQIGGVAAVVAVVGLLLSILGVVGSGLWIVAAIVAVACAILFRSTVRR